MFVRIHILPVAFTVSVRIPPPPAPTSIFTLTDTLLQSQSVLFLTWHFKTILNMCTKSLKQLWASGRNAPGSYFVLGSTFATDVRKQCTCDTSVLEYLSCSSTQTFGGRGEGGGVAWCGLSPIMATKRVGPSLFIIMRHKFLPHSQLAYCVWTYSSRWSSQLLYQGRGGPPVAPTCLLSNSYISQLGATFDLLVLRVNPKGESTRCGKNNNLSVTFDNNSQTQVCTRLSKPVCQLTVLNHFVPNRFTR